MKRDDVLRKIRACFRLSKSANASEAAAAARQAHALMHKYGIDLSAVEGIESCDSPTRARGAALTKSVTALASVVAAGYRCEVVIARVERTTTRVRFYGYSMDATVAAYAFTVLRRQMDSDRLAYTKTHLSRIRSEAQRRSRAERFAYAWVAAVHDLFPADPETEVRSKSIMSVIEAHGITSTHEAREVRGPRKSSVNDTVAGYHSGRKAQLRKGLAGSADAPSEAPAQLGMFSTGLLEQA